MRREEFAGLPVSVALGLLYDATPALASVPMPHIPLPPKYDGRLSKKGGFVWMSELNLESLRYWHGKKKESAAANTQYSEKDGKTATQLEKWITWRTVCPADVWSGTRGDDRVTGAPPSRDPALHEWDNSKRDAPRGAPEPAGDTEDDYSDVTF